MARLKLWLHNFTPEGTWFKTPRTISQAHSNNRNKLENSKIIFVLQNRHYFYFLAEYIGDNFWYFKRH